MILQGAKSQIDSAHEPEHLLGEVHGHTWHVEVFREIDPDKFIPCALQWECYVHELTKAFDHRILKKGEGLAEQLAMALGQVSGATMVRVWRTTRKGEISALWFRRDR